MILKTFSSYHPFAILLYFVTIIGFTMFSAHPIYLFISLINSIFFVVTLKRFKTIPKSLAYSFAVFFIISISNPFFTHNGLTVLLYVNDKPITLEAFFYGISIATMLIAVVFWFNSLNKILTSEKIIYLFGRVIPSIALIIAMTLRLIPKARHQLGIITNSQKSMGMDYKTGTISQRIRAGSRIISILITWMLENGVDTASSMKARGYGLSSRSSYSSYRFRKEDFILTFYILSLSTIMIWSNINSINSFYYYPKISNIGVTTTSTLCYIAFFFLTAIPIVINAFSALSFRKSQKENSNVMSILDGISK